MINKKKITTKMNFSEILEQDCLKFLHFEIHHPRKLPGKGWRVNQLKCCEYNSHDENVGLNSNASDIVSFVTEKMFHKFKSK